MILKEVEAKNLLENFLRYSKADSIILNLTGRNLYNLRFANTSHSTNGFSDSLSLIITSNIGKKSGSVEINRLDKESVKSAIMKSEEIAKLSPENQEFMPPLEPQIYLTSNNFSNNTENLTFENHADIISYIINESLKFDLISAGYLENKIEFLSIMNSNNLFTYNLSSSIKLSSTIRTKDGTGSSKIEHEYVDVKNLDINKITDRVINKSVNSANPVELKPGRYKVILESSAVADLITYLLNFMDARSSDEGRSYFSSKVNGNKIGEQLADSIINIYSDPTDDRAPSITFTFEGIPRNKIIWFENGILKNLRRSRYWAKKTNQPVIPYPSNLIMDGSGKTLSEIIADTDRAILVTRLWYIRTVDPQTMLLTGLTRDGIFEIVDGKISKSIKNFRFNESPINVLSNILDIGIPEKTTGSGTGNLQVCVPPLKVDNFNFSSLSDAI